MQSRRNSALGAALAWAQYGGLVAMLAVAVVAFGIASLTAGVPAPATPEPVVLSGPSVKLGEGTIRTYLEVVDGVATELGVAMTEGVMRGLPSGHAHHGAIDIGDGLVTFEHVLDLPANNPTPYRQALVHWNPGGHEPPGTYDEPHFDFHFQLIDEALRATITPEHPEWEARGSRLPASARMPQGFEAWPPAVPGMGVHWIDPTSPELNGEKFTKTFLFGSWDGELVFAEPMITKAFLESRPNYTAALPLPRDKGGRGYHPTRYGVRWDPAAREYRVSLQGFSK